MNFKINITSKKLLADTFTPVSIYLKLRDKFPNSILLESSDYHGNENSFSFICCKPIAGIKVENETIFCSFPDGSVANKKIDKSVSVAAELKMFGESFEMNANTPFADKIMNGLFGYIAYDSVRYFEDIEIRSEKKEEKRIPDVNYNLYQYVIAIDHFKDEITIFQHSFDKDENGIELLEAYINNKNFTSINSSSVKLDASSPSG